jgi:hypothetical protein
MAEPFALSIARDGSLRATVVPLDLPPLEPGQARFRIGRLALTANTVTYATFGDAMRYWDFFPAADGTGRVPAWGFATIVESRAEAAPEGERVWGFWPVASHATLTPVSDTEWAFDDAAPHRADLPRVYNSYPIDIYPDTPEGEARRAVFEPLFLTAFVLAMELRSAADGAGAITITGASSKTALALAAILRDAPLPGVTIEGLTSPGNRDFVAASGLYDRVAAYDDLILLAGDRPRLIVDMAGSAAVNRALHTRFGDRLLGNIRVGAAHWSDSAPARDLPGPKPRFFFAPDAFRAVLRQLGDAEVVARMGIARGALSKGAHGLISMHRLTGPEGALAGWSDLVAGRVKPDRALVLEP